MSREKKVTLRRIKSTQDQHEFDELRRIVKQGGDFCKDLAVILQERSELEIQYAKGLSKLSGKLLKASKEGRGSVAHAWQAVAVQIETQSELHRIWATALIDEIGKPLRNSTETQQKIRKSVEILVDKTTKNLTEWRVAETKAKRQCFSSSKEFEKIQESRNSIPLSGLFPLSIDPPPLSLSTAPSTTSLLDFTNSTNSLLNNCQQQRNSSVLAEVRARSRVLSIPPPDKDPIKLEAKRRKAEEAVRRADIEYYTFCVRSEKARLECEGALRNGLTCLRTLEEERLGLLKDLASKYFHHLHHLLPKLIKSGESLLNPIQGSNVDQDMESSLNDFRRHPGSEQLLPDFYAEDTSNLMCRDRRMEALQKFHSIIKQDLEREKKGLIRLPMDGFPITSVAIRVPLDQPANPQPAKIPTHAEEILEDRLNYIKTLLLYFEGSKTKIENAIADQEGRQRGNYAITQYMRHQRDKQGLPQTILKVPNWARDECLNYPMSSSSSSSNADSGSGRSLSPDWREKQVTPEIRESSNLDDVEEGLDEFSSDGSIGDTIVENFFDQPITDLESSSCELLTSKSEKLIGDMVPSIGTCRVIYDYESAMFDELTIRAGDVLNIHDKQEDGWWLGELNGQIGIFPATYVELILEEEGVAQ